MELRNIFKNSSFDTLDKNKEFLEEHDLLNIMGSPNRVFLKFLNSKGMDINEDEITKDLIEEFEESRDSINLRLQRIQKQKEIIFSERKVWINIRTDDEIIGSDLILHHDRITIDESGFEIPYSEMLCNIENQNYDEIDALLELNMLYEEGKISAEELEARKALIYSDDVYCTNCGTKIDADSVFCPECGHEVLD